MARVGASLFLNNIVIILAFIKLYENNMRKLLMIASLCIGFISSAQNPGKLLHYGGTSQDISYGACKGNGTDFFTSGYFTGTVTMGSTTLVSSGAEDIYIAKHDSSGHVLWAKKAGGSGSDMGFSISYNDGYAYITGAFNGTATFGSTTITSSGQADGFIAKYASNGNLIWAKKAGGSSALDRTDEIVFEGGNTMYLCASYFAGVTYGGVTLSNTGGSDAYILKLDTAGNLLKHVNMGGTSNDYTYDLKLANGSLFIAGNFASNIIDFGPAIGIANLGTYDGFVAKYDTALNAVWANTIGGNGWDDFEKLIVDSNGNCFVTGYFTDLAFLNDSSLTTTISGTRDGCVVKYDSTGTLVWAKKVGAHDAASGREIKFGTTQNEIEVYGFFGIRIDNHSQSDSSNGASDGFILKYDQNGNTTSMYTFGGSGSETICEVAKVGNKVWVSGGIADSSVFNNDTVVSNGGNDIGIWEFVTPMITPPTGVKETTIEANGFTMYPNPSEDKFMLEGDDNILRVEIYNLIGEIVFSVEANDKQITLDHNLKGGLYFVVVNGNKNNAHKLLIQ